MPTETKGLNLKTTCPDSKRDVGLAYKAGIHWGITDTPTLAASLMPQPQGGCTAKIIDFLEDVVKGYEDAKKARRPQPPRYRGADNQFVFEEAYAWTQGQLPKRCFDCTFKRSCYKEAKNQIEEPALVFILE